MSITSTAYNNYDIDSVKRDDMRLCYKYDPLGRVQSLTEKVGADSYTTGYTYDANGMLQTRTYPSGFAVQYSYVNGAITAIRKAANSAAIWELTGINAMGQITSYRNGNDFNDIELGYDTYFNPTTKKLRGVIYAGQSVNPQSGNLSSRSVGAKSESFGYDSQNRLTSWNDSQSATYSDNGNIEFKTGVGDYSYDAQHPHAVAGVTENIAALNQDIVYNEAGRATSIEEGNYRMMLDYGMDDQRVKTFLYENGALIKEKHFASGYEKEIVGNSTREISYIDAPSGLTAIVVRSGGVDSLFYVYTDHQGSILQLNNEAGTMVEQRVYDPWGRERDPNDWNNYLTDVGYRRTDRGYIGQEHLPQFGLINLNARLYDPLLGQFLSPDPFVQAPDASQNFNRYSYCLNNPLVYIDPDGENPFMIALAVYVLFFTDMGYDLQKTISPVAAKVDLRFGNHQGAIGIDASVGIPQMFPLSYRVHGGATYFWKNEDLMGNNMSGWETRYGAEWGISGYMFGVPIAYTYGGTTFNSKWSGKQTTNLMTLGNPFTNVKYENDSKPVGPFKYIPFVPKGDGDRYRTAAVQINFGLFGIGTNMVTGDAGPDRSDKGHWEYINGHKTYVPYTDDDGHYYNPDNYRNGIFYFRIGPFRLGWNSENTRKVFQNEFAHDFLMGGKNYWFNPLDLKPKFYWGFGYSGGGTLY